MLYRVRLSDGRCDYVSESVTRLIGRSPHTFLDARLPLRGVLTPESQRLFDEHWERLAAGLPVPPVAHTAVHAETGEHIRIRVDEALVRDSGGRPIAVEGLAVTLDEQPFRQGPTLESVENPPHDLARELPREIRGTLQTVLDAIPIRLFWKDLDSVYLGCNQPFAEDAGLERPEQILGKRDDELAWVEQADLYRGDDRAVMQSGQERINYEEPQDRPDGLRTWLRTSKRPLRDEQGRIFGVLGCYEDFTERKRAEAELLRFKNILDATTDLVGIANSDGEMLYMNRAGRRLMGLSDDAELDGLDWRISQPETAVEHGERKAYSTAIQTGSWSGEAPMRARDGRIVPTSQVILWHPPDPERGEPGYDSAIMRDISEIKNAEAKIRSLNRDLERRVVERTADLDASNRELEAFAHSVSHDLRAPLRALAGFSQVLQEDYGGQLDAEGSRILGRIARAALRMGVILDGLSELARITRAPLSREPVNLSAMAQRILHERHESEAERNVEIAVAPNLVAHADPKLVEILLENLLANAWKFTRDSKRARIEVGATRHEGADAWFVRDNGAGFDMAYADQLFTTFQRLHDDARFHGTGIGLATAQRVVRRHGGQLWGEGKIDAGATFTFTLAPG
jgi:PAS domain S-box-containing protein